MAREGKKLELYEILAAKRAKGKAPLALDPKATRSGTPAEAELEERIQVASGSRVLPGIIVDEAVNPEAIPGFRPPEAPAPVDPEPYREPKRSWFSERPAQPQPLPESVPAPAPEPPRPKSPREVVFALDTAFIFFVVVLALVGSSYFLGYKRGQEEKPAGLAGIGDIEVVDRNHIKLNHLSLPPRTTIRPPEQDYTLVLRTEPAGDDLPERLEMELAEAVLLGRNKGGGEFPSFIFRTGGASPLYILAVGLGRTGNDPELAKLLEIYYNMDGVTLSREPFPYRSSRVAPVRELGTPVH